MRRQGLDFGPTDRVTHTTASIGMSSRRASRKVWFEGALLVMLECVQGLTISLHQTRQRLPGKVSQRIQSLILESWNFAMS